MQTHRALGHRLFRLGRYEEAVAAFRRAYEVKADARLLSTSRSATARSAPSIRRSSITIATWPAGLTPSIAAEVEEKVAELESMRADRPRRARRSRRAGGAP